MVKIKKVECPESKIGIKCPYEMKPSRIVIYNADNDKPAKDVITDMHLNGNTISYHFACDDKEIVQGIDLKRNAFHAGDGKNGKGNREGIAIIICYGKSGGERFSKAQKNAAELAAKLLKENGWGIDKVTKRSDYCSENRPNRTVSEYGWNYFVKLVKGFMPETEKKETTAKKTTKKNAD